MSDKALDQTEREIVTDDFSDEALEAAAGTDRRPGGFITFAPIWCPDSAPR
jgi:hypothetical protein